MTYVKHKYGSHKKEIKALLNERLDVRQRIRYYSLKLAKIERELEEVIDLARKESGVKAPPHFHPGSFIVLPSRNES